MRGSRNKAPLIPILLKGEKEVAVTSNNLSNLTSVPSQISEQVIPQKAVNISKWEKQSQEAGTVL